MLGFRTIRSGHGTCGCYFSRGQMTEMLLTRSLMKEVTIRSYLCIMSKIRSGNSRFRVLNSVGRTAPVHSSVQSYSGPLECAGMSVNSVGKSQIREYRSDGDQAGTQGDARKRKEHSPGIVDPTANLKI